MDPDYMKNCGQSKTDVEAWTRVETGGTPALFSAVEGVDELGDTYRQRVPWRP